LKGGIVIRESLKKFNGTRVKGITGRFDRFGAVGGMQMSVLLDDLTLDGVSLTSHAWVSIKDEMKGIAVNRGDIITFDADAATYTKRDGAIDYGLAKPSNINVIKRSSHSLSINRIKHLKFTVEKYAYVWISIKGRERQYISYDATKIINSDVTISVGDTIELELGSVSENGSLKYDWRINDSCWHSDAIIDIFKFGQQVNIEGYCLAIPDALYFLVKDVIMKILLSRVPFSLPYKNELKHCVALQPETVIVNIAGMYKQSQREGV